MSCSPLPARVAKEPGFVAGIHEPKNQRYSQRRLILKHIAFKKPHTYLLPGELISTTGQMVKNKASGWHHGMNCLVKLWASFHPNCFPYDCTISSSIKTEHQQVWLLCETSPKIIGSSHLHGELGRSPMIGWLNQTINTLDIQSSRAKSELRGFVGDFLTNPILGGFNPFEKYARQIGSSPQLRLKTKNLWSHLETNIWGGPPLRSLGPEVKSKKSS